MARSERISPTAHYTAYVWYRAGLSHPALTSTLGRVLHAALRPVNLAYETVGDRPSLDQMLLARHRVIDHLLERAVASGQVRQVIEVAAGLSPRGLTFTRRHPGLTYVEADLPDMVATKRDRLREAGPLLDRHRIVVCDALADDGPRSLAAIAATHLETGQPAAIITEGLLGYFDLATVQGMWRRFARVLGGFSRGLYLSDLHLAGDTAHMRGSVAFRALLAAFTRGRVYLHFDTSAEATAALREAGFATAAAYLPGEVDGVTFAGRDRRYVVRILEAWT